MYFFGIVRTHLTSDKQIWSLAHLLKPTVDHASYDARRALKPQFLSRNKVVRQFVVDNGRKASPRALQDLLSSSGLGVSYHTCADACAIVKSELFQSDRLQFQLILSYIHEMNKRRHRADIDFDGTTIRRVVVVYRQGIQAASEFSDRGLNMDGTFMKHSSGGTFLVACLRNSNNEIHIVAVAWVSAVDKTKWSAAYSPCARFGMMTSSNVESVNSALMAAREEPLLDCLMTIEKYLSGKWVKFTGKMTKWGQLTDYAEKQFVGKRLARGFDGMEVFSQCSSSFNVKVKRDGQLSTEYAIDRDKASDPCSCGYFQYMDAPCVHVVASLKHINNLSILREFIGTSWTTAVYKQAYNPLLKMPPTVTKDELLRFEHHQPPPVPQKRGRPKKSKKRIESQPASLALSKKSAYTCSACGCMGHSKRSCSKL
uniref:Uncharacterized protein AlNc14C204G8777 n=1 Tax=Albugo laibachii Nc14 TaxID=890382 RepID=F0WQW8_9STRA|nr:putative protein [Albugo laibachii Nc14]|eukprot:CCA23727.1 putative protein [Albugo laibachii Nc14]